MVASLSIFWTHHQVPRFSLKGACSLENVFITEKYFCNVCFLSKQGLKWGEMEMETESISPEKPAWSGESGLFSSVM